MDVERCGSLVREESDEVGRLEARDVARAEVVDYSWKLVGCWGVGQCKSRVHRQLTVLLTKRDGEEIGGRYAPIEGGVRRYVTDSIRSGDVRVASWILPLYRIDHCTIDK